jgi:hypothetical protein
MSTTSRWSNSGRNHKLYADNHSSPAGGSANLKITEVAPWSSSNSPFGEDWFEVTNFGTANADITVGPWMTIQTRQQRAAVWNLVIKPGESVIFIEIQPGHNATTERNGFISTWFGNNLPPGLQVGTYTQGVAGGVGLGTGGDQVNLFNGVAGTRQANVAFGASNNTPPGPFLTFDNTVGHIVHVIFPPSAPSALMAPFAAPGDTREIGSPGTIGAPTAPVTTIAATDDIAAEEPVVTLANSVFPRTGNTLSALTVSYTISGSANNADYTPELDRSGDHPGRTVLRGHHDNAG